MIGPQAATGEQKPKAVLGVLSSRITLSHSPLIASSPCTVQVHDSPRHPPPAVHPRATDTVNGSGWGAQDLCLPDPSAEGKLLENIRDFGGR